MELVDTILKLSQVGATALLLLALFGAYRGWWVPGRAYDEAVKREASWKEMYEREKTARESDRDKEPAWAREVKSDVREIAQGLKSRP